MIWEDLVKTTLIGTDKANPSVKTLEGLQKLGISSSDTTEAVLEGAGVLALLRKGAIPLNNFNGKMPEECVEEMATMCSAKSAQHLKEILKGRYGAALPEFIFYAENNNRILPPESLPLLFHKARGDRKMQALLSPIIGKRGEWLAQQNGDWAGFLEKKEKTTTPFFTKMLPSETLTKANELIERFKGYAFIWSDDRQLNIEMRDFAYLADESSIDNLSYLFEQNISVQWQNKTSEMLMILKFRKEMVTELSK